MPGKRSAIKSGSWEEKNGLGLIFLILAGMVLITVLTWSSGADWRGVELGVVILITCFLLYVGQQNSAAFDVDRRSILLRQRRIWKKNTREIPFDEVLDVAVVSSSTGTTSRTHKVMLVLKSGEQVQITAHPSSTKWPKQKLARQIADTLNQYRSQPITPALDGVVKVERKGEINGVPWRITFRSANDMVPVTHWHSQAAKFNGGFLLFIPAKNIGNPGTGILNKTTRFFYRQFLKTLMIDDKTIPGFENAVPLQKTDYPLGNLFTCITSDPASAQTWLTESLMEKINQWQSNSPLAGAKGEKDPHLLLTADGALLILKKIYFRDHEIQQIAEFGTSLIEGHLD
jgi:hypothetical protein